MGPSKEESESSTSPAAVPEAVWANARGDEKPGSAVLGDNAVDDTGSPAGNAKDGDNVEGDKTADTEKSEAPTQQYMTGLPFVLTFGSLILATLLSALNASMISTAIPSITNAFHSIQDVGWYSSSYLISNCAMLPLTGKIFAIFPLRYTFIVFVFILEVGNLISGVAVSSPMLIVGRSITGIGGSGILTGATAIITTIRPLEKRPMLIGTLMAGVALGQVGGPLLGGALAQVTWRWVFYINLPIGGIVILLFLFIVRLPAPTEKPKLLQVPTQNTDDQDDRADNNAAGSGSGIPAQVSRRQHLGTMYKQVARIDFPGFVCFAAACALFLIGLEWGGTKYAWGSGVVIGLLVAGAVLFGVFAAWSQYLGDRALLPFRLLRYGYVNVFCGITALAQSASVFVLMSYLPIWFQGVKGATPVVSGVMLLPTIVAQLLAAFLCGFLVQRTGYYMPELLSGNSMVLIASGLFTTFSPSTGAGSWIGFQILGGAGRGFVNQLLVTVIQANVPPSDIPLGVSYVLFCQYFGGAVAICAARTVLTSTIGAALAKYAPSVDAATVINTGVTDLRHVIPASDINGVVLAYNKALVNVYYLQIAFSATALVCSSFLGWRDIRKPTPVQTEKSDVENAKTETPEKTETTEKTEKTDESK
ncbi:hypothetical protein HMPREF1624_02656 [Sporothrix schenckii ATCC 58251]|uniref:Major facilitator superfamily (MFS) profile domain-containing protein n=1 Tax=Sporothrix schenckii (strain ATCC 58251 / de Perez 2211183) TaxID=1391915 RepID=U7Q353_SPOS1|nr:hypothetical protein HMPREF1624_02656 [Sporothrix schenckii ATCC 58251]